MERLKYISTERLFEGVIVAVDGCSVTIDLLGRLGQLKVPKRMLISDDAPLEGQLVGFLMSYPEVINPIPDEKYISSINKRKNIEQ